MTTCFKCNTTDDENFTPSTLKRKSAMCRKCMKEYQKQYRKEKIDEVKEWRKKYYQRKRNEVGFLETRQKYLDEWKEKNKQHIRNYDNNYYKKEDRNIIKKMRARLHCALKNGRGVKKKNTIDYLGCTIEEFKLYLKSKFTEGMTWDLLMCGEIHIDHIRPCSSFNLTKEDEIEKCFHYKNMQPLWAKDNLTKGANYEE